MSAVARRIRATPERSASNAWRIIVNLLAPADGSARQELLSIEGIASSIIATESPKEAPIVVCGKGPRIRIYCLYDEDAISGDNASETALAQSPTDAEWLMSLPSDADDVMWIKDALKKKTTRVTVRDKAETFDATSDDGAATTATRAAAINMEAFLRS